MKRAEVEAAMAAGRDIIRRRSPRSSFVEACRIVDIGYHKRQRWEREPRQGGSGVLVRILDHEGNEGRTEVFPPGQLYDITYADWQAQEAEAHRIAADARRAIREHRQEVAERCRAAIETLGVGRVGDAYSSPHVHLTPAEAEALAAVVADARAVVEAQQ